MLLGWNPYSILDPGFHLSFAAVAAIFVVVPALERTLSGMPRPGKPFLIFAVASICCLATAPILWLQGGSIPVWSVIANALVEPIVAPLLGFGLLTALLADPLPDAAAGLGWVKGHLADYLVWCAETIGGAPHARVESGRWALVVTFVSMAPFAWLGLFYGLAAHLRLSLGRWPERLNENPHGWLFNLHFNATGLGFIGILLGLLVVPAATLILLAWPSRRRWALYPLIFGAATLLAWVLLHLAPASFLYWWWD